MILHNTASNETDADCAQGFQSPRALDSDALGYSAEELSAYYYELECLLVQIETAETHYKVLGIEYLSTTGEITTAFFKAMILINPETYGLETNLPEELEHRVKLASDRVSEAFRVLMDFDERVEYDGRLYGWEDKDSKRGGPKEQRVKSKRKGTKTKQKASDRRARQRFELSLPVTVTGYDQDARDWHEAVQSVDLSRSGACLLLRRRVLVGNVLYLRMPMPIVLRRHDYVDQTYGTYAIVRWIRPPRDGFRLAGVELIGEFPPLGFRERPWAAFQIGKWDGADRRAESRETVSETIEIEYFDESEQLIRQGTGFIEDISASGVRVCVEQPPLEADLIRIVRPKASMSAFALVRNRYKGRDGFERLCGQFIGRNPVGAQQE